MAMIKQLEKERFLKTKGFLRQPLILGHCEFQVFISLYILNISVSRNYAKIRYVIKRFINMLSRVIIMLLTVVFSTLTSEHVNADNDINKKAESNQVITPVTSGDIYKNWIFTQMLTDGNSLLVT